MQAQEGAASFYDQGFGNVGVQADASYVPASTHHDWGSSTAPSLAQHGDSDRDILFFPNHCVGVTTGGFDFDLLADASCASYGAPPIGDLLDAASAPGAPVDPGQLATSALDRAIALAARPDIRVAPRHRGITGLRTFVWLQARPQTIEATAEVPGMTVTAQASPVRFIWDFGDGGRRATTHHGRPWTRRRPGSIGYTYESKGRYTLTATIVYAARWRMNGGQWRPLGYFTTSSFRPYPVAEVVPRLTRSRR